LLCSNGRSSAASGVLMMSPDMCSISPIWLQNATVTDRFLFATIFWHTSVYPFHRMPRLDMARKRSHDLSCSVARALDEVGDWWSLLIVKEAMIGTRRFVDFQHNLGIARNILCNRLAQLVENGVLVKRDVGEHGIRYEYRLTDKGR